MATEFLQDKVISYLADGGRTQAWLSKKLSVSPQMLCMWLKYKVSFNSKTIQLIREIIDAE